MPTVEAIESLWDMSSCISRGIKENMQRKTLWKDKCVGTLWRTQKWKLSLGNNMKYFFTLNPQWIQCNFFPLLTMSLWHYCVFCKVGAGGSVVVLQYLEKCWIKLSSELPYLRKYSWTGMQRWILRLQFSENPPWKWSLYIYDHFSFITVSSLEVSAYFYLVHIQD